MKISLFPIKDGFKAWHIYWQSIVCSVLVSVLLKVARKQKINIEQAVAVELYRCRHFDHAGVKTRFEQSTGIFTDVVAFAALGILLPSVFVIMGKSVDAAGIVKSDAAQRLSLFLPIVASFTLFHEQLTEGRLIGLVLAFTALFFLLWKSDGGKKSGGFSTQVMLLLSVWCGYGVIDILFKQVAKSGTAFAGNLLVAFLFGGILMFGYLFAKGSKWTKEGHSGRYDFGLSELFEYCYLHLGTPNHEG